MHKNKSIRDPKVAVVGCGHWGKNLVRNFSELGALAAVCDASELMSKKMAQSYGVPALSVSEILTSTSIEAVAIAVPTESHYALGRACLEAGKHIFVEKPLAQTLENAEELCRLAADSDKILMVGHLLQYHPAFLSLKEMVNNNAIGKIEYIYSNRLNLGKIRREENSLWSFAPHDISMMLSLMGNLPNEVFAMGHNYLHHAIADATITTMRFPGGASAHIFVSWLHPFKEQRLVVVGQSGMLVFDDANDWPAKLLLYPHEINWKDGMPTPKRADAVPQLIEEKEPLYEECLHFLNCVASHQQPRTPGEEGLRVLRVLDAAQKSMSEKRPIGLSPQADFYAHNSAIIDTPTNIGKHTKIWHFSHILQNTHVGERCNIGQNVVIGPNVTIGDDCKIQNNVSIYDGVKLEDNVFCGPSCVFTNVVNPRAAMDRKSEFKPTVVRTGATIGANATILCGIEIGKHALIGAGAVVLHDVPNYALVVGNPGRISGYVCSCGESLTKSDWTETVCRACSDQFKRGDDGEVVQAKIL